MEVFNLKDSIEGVRSAMDDGIHLNPGMLGLLMDHVIMKTEENLAGRKKGPTERAGPAVKKARVASDGGYRGVPKGGMGGKGEGGGCRRQVVLLLLLRRVWSLLDVKKK